MKTLITFAVLVASLFWVYSVFGEGQEEVTYFYDESFNITHQHTARDQAQFSKSDINDPGLLLFEPNDPFYEDQWALNNTNQIGSCSQCYDSNDPQDINAEAGWDIKKGDPDVVICIIDLGMDMEHPDLIGQDGENLVPQNGDDWDFCNGPEDISPDEGHLSKHGTACMGVAAAIINNSAGIAGVAGECRIMPLRGACGASFTSLINAINYAVGRRQEFDGLVISISLPAVGDYNQIGYALQNAFDNDVVICAAAGNYKAVDGPSGVAFPASHEKTIAVAATSPCDKLKTPSSCDDEDHWGSECGSEIDVAAPGVHIYTTDVLGTDGYDTNPSPDGDYYADFGGTSAASPLVAGIAGVVWSIDPTLTNEQIYDIIRHSADQVGGYIYSASTGKSLQLGHGRVNMARACTLAQEDIRWAEYRLYAPAHMTRKHDVLAIDLDDDDDMDILSTEFYNDAIIWWENDGSENWTKHTVSSNVDGAKTVCAGYLNNDDDIDIVAGGEYAESLYWWINDGSENFTEYSVSCDSGTVDIYIEKIDSDSYFDIVCAVSKKNKIVWWKNDGQNGFEEKTVVSKFTGAASVYAVDLDEDGDTDVLGAAKEADKISWFENIGSEKFTEHVLASSFDGASGVYAEDMDGDDDIDILACAESESEIKVWENTGTSFVLNTISGQFEGATDIFADTLSDNDYRDIIIAAPDDNAVLWWENEGDFEFSNMMILGWDFAQAWGVYAADIDGDTDIDIVGAAASTVEKITWWESDLDPITPKRESEDQMVDLPGRLLVSSPYPNPFNATITIQYDLPEDCHVIVDIYDILGRHVKTLMNAAQPAGSHHMIWNAADRSSGIYFYRIQAGEFTDTKKMTLLK